MNTRYYGDNLIVRIPPTSAGLEGFMKAGKSEKYGLKQEESGI
jgi:hypothetical protein